MADLHFNKIDSNDLKSFKAIQSTVMAEVIHAVTKANISITIKEEKGAYSDSQRGALHMWCRMCSDNLNRMGLTRSGKSRMTGEPIEFPWTETHFKAFYKDVLFEYTGQLSTEEQSSKDPSDVQNIICKYFADRGASLPPWPSYR